MVRLWSETELRRFNFIKILANNEDWVKLDNIAEELDCSTRVLSKDISFIKSNFDGVDIETSKYGVRVNLDSAEGILSIAQQFINKSAKYNLVERIFFTHNQSVDEISKSLFQSTATTYRLIKEINLIFEEFSMKIETNPCRIVGDEDKVRSFFYVYFNDKYDYSNYPFSPHIDEENLDKILTFFADYTQVQSDFAFYNTFKLVSSVNIIRYKQGNLINTEHIEANISEVMPRNSIYQIYAQMLAPYERKLGLSLNYQFVEQVWPAYIDKNFSLNYARLEEKCAKDPDTAEAVNFLREGFQALIDKFDLHLSNEEELIHRIMNRAHLADREGQSGYILFDRNEAFSLTVKDDYPKFHSALMSFVKDFIAVIGRPYTEHLHNYLFYIAFITWNHLLVQLRNKIYSVKALVTSERNLSHSHMLKSILQSELSSLTSIDIYEDRGLEDSIHPLPGYDIYITDYPTHKYYHNHIYIESIPKILDIRKLQDMIARIVAARREDYSKKIDLNNLNE